MDQSTGLAKQVQSELPVQFSDLELTPNQQFGLVIVDEVNGYCTVGAGNYAPVAEDKQISSMISETCKTAKMFSARGWPILVFLDEHEPDRPEPPFKPHCIRGTGEEKLVPELAWLEQDPHALLMQKDCVDGLTGGYKKDGSNVVVDWIGKHQIHTLVVAGICTDLCVMNFVIAALSARNHGMLCPLKDIAVYSKGCATYDLPPRVAKDIGGSPHPQNFFQHMAFYFMALNGAIVVNNLKFTQAHSS